MESPRYDVIILGGAYSGGAAANRLLDEAPQLKVLIIEGKAEFDAKVGEATVELSSLFMHRKLGLWDHLVREQLPKQGLRFWFHNEKTRDLLDSAEIGPYTSTVVPAFQLMRDRMDEKILSNAVLKGAMLARPARVTKVELKDYDNTVTYSGNGAEKTARAPWVIDATGKATLLGRQLGLIENNERHPIAAVWARFTGVVNMDGNLYPGSDKWNRSTITARRLATNHFPGFGYWVWVIPLHDGSTSVGLVYDKRLVKLPAGPRGAAFLEFMKGIPGLRQLMADAVMREGDLRNYDQVSYVSRQYMGRGWALVGDAAAFMDPFYSPGLDHCSISVEKTTRLIRRQLGGDNTAMTDKLIARHNTSFNRSYHWFHRALFKDKYFYMGEFDLMSCALMIDTCFYYFFLVRWTYANPSAFNVDPPFDHPVSYPFNLFHRFFGWRLKTMAVNRIRAGAIGRVNDGRRLKLNFAFGWRAERILLTGLRLWAVAELKNLFYAPRAWLKPAASLDDLIRLAAPIRPQTVAPAARESAPIAPMEKLKPTT
jgi:flavin-dependent dehydrogenase